MEVIKLKRLLGITDDSEEIAIQFILDDVESKVKEYCHINEIPKTLETTCYRMAIDVYRNEAIGQEEKEADVSSISEGDTSVSYKQREKDNYYMESVLKDYRAQLNRYRKVVW